MTIRSPVPPAGSNWTEWHAARDAEVRAQVLFEVREELSYAVRKWYEDPRIHRDAIAHLEVLVVLFSR